MKLGEVNTLILTFVMLDVFMYYTLPQFLSFFKKNISIISMYLQAEPKTVQIKIYWILISQLILFYIVSKQDISSV